jgi:hypothetical protein
VRRTAEIRITSSTRRWRRTSRLRRCTPGDVKPALARHLNQILQPVRDHFTNNPEAKKLLDTIKKYKVTK